LVPHWRGGVDRRSVVLFPDDESIPVMAIHAVDEDRAVEAMDTVCELLEPYRPLREQT
jgi:hypothetical protein